MYLANLLYITGSFNVLSFSTKSLQNINKLLYSQTRVSFYWNSKKWSALDNQVNQVSFHCFCSKSDIYLFLKNFLHFYKTPDGEKKKGKSIYIKYFLVQMKLKKHLLYNTMQAIEKTQLCLIQQPANISYLVIFRGNSCSNTICRKEHNLFIG